MAKRHGGPRPLYFESFRAALARAPEGLIRVAPPASDAQIAAAERALGIAVPLPFATFLRSFDGADLFHESVVICGVGPDAFRSLVAVNRGERHPLVRADEIVFAEASGGDTLLLSPGADEPRVIRLRPGSDERWLSGSTFARWLDAVIAREQILYDAGGEFVLEAFEPDGEELTATFALRQAERALKKDPDAAEPHHDLGVAYRRLGKLDRAASAFARAAGLDPENPWPWFDLGRARLQQGEAAPAVEAFRRAGEATPGAEGARFFAWAARAAMDAGRADEATAAREQARARDPEIVAVLTRAAQAAAREDDAAGVTEAQALAAVFAAPTGRKLPVR